MAIARLGAFAALQAGGKALNCIGSNAKNTFDLHRRGFAAFPGLGDIRSLGFGKRVKMLYALRHIFIACNTAAIEHKDHVAIGGNFLVIAGRKHAKPYARAPKLWTYCVAFFP